MVKPLLIGGILMLSLSGPVLAGTVYKCRNAEGGLQYQERPCGLADTVVKSWTSASFPQAEGQGVLTISRGRDGHYSVEGAVNDHYLSFMIDTGAAMVGLPLAMTTRFGMACRQNALMNTANGETQGCLVIIDKLRVGQFTVHHVEAVAMPNLSQPLLGMNVLKLFRMEQEAGELRLFKRY